MTNAKTTKRALFMSVISLLLCSAMLIGTTFAWFTDSVASAINTIASGSLDIELYYQLEGQTDWTKVTETTNVFKEDALWEPGYTEIVKLKVVNEGDLALKYNLGVNVASEVGSVNVNGDDFLLSEYIKFAVVDGANTYTREEAVAAAEAAGATALKTAYNSGVTALLANEEAIVTMVVYMPTTVGNEANAAKGAETPTIHLGINLFATQHTYEEDSFGDQYDKDAADPEPNNGEVWDGTVVPSLEKAADGKYHITSGAELAYLNTLLKGMPEQEGIKVVLDADIDLGNKDWTPIGYLDTCAFHGQFDGNGHTIKNVKVVASKNDGAENAGLFGVAKYGYTKIFDLTVENITISGESERVGGIVGMMNGGTIEGCHVVNADLQIGSKVGGIVGDLVGVAMNNCTVSKSTIVSSDYAGALTARTREDGSTVSISNCKAIDCAVTGVSGKVGELVGYQLVSVSLADSTATNVTVTAK